MKKIFIKNFISIIVSFALEIIFKLFVGISFNTYDILSLMLYSLFASTIVTLITNIFSDKGNKVLLLITYFMLSLLFGLEYVFKAFMKIYFSIDMIKLSDQAVGFLGTTLSVILSKIVYILIFFLPFIILLLFKREVNYHNDNRKKTLLIYIILILITYGGYILSLNIDKKDNMSLKEIYFNVNNVNLSIPRLGVLSSIALDSYYEVINPSDKMLINNNINKVVNTISDNKNIMNIDLSNYNLDSEVKTYIENNPGTNKNNYTSFFEGKNLILIVAESYSEVGVSKDLTPTLYNLTHSGFTFNNFYVPYYLSTIGGEYQVLTGLYPSSDILTTWKSGENSFPYGIANMFEEKGYNTYAYHGHDGYFQNRYKYLKALGFDNFKACNMNLDIDCDKFPESDLEMIDKTYTDYINSDKPFMAYYMTVSGHLYYNFTTNDIAIKNRDYVDSLEYDDSTKAYLASEIELDRALELLITKLKENNKLDDTVIVMVADHYPYGLELEEINKLSTYKRDDLFEKNHNSLIIWNSKMNNKNIDKVGMSIDILPTIYNLFGIEYDSRLLAGSDLLSNSEGIAIFNDLSWITGRGKYYSTTGTFTSNNDTEYINRINNEVHDKLLFSKNVLINDSYRYIK